MFIELTPKAKDVDTKRAWRVVVKDGPMAQGVAYFESLDSALVAIESTVDHYHNRLVFEVRYTKRPTGQ